MISKDPAPTVTARPGRAVSVVALAAVVALGGAVSPVAAAGTGGIEVTPVPAVRDGKPVTTFRIDVPSRGEQVVPFTVRNVADGERSAAVYVAGLTEDDGSFAIDERGPSPYVEMDRQEVTLQAGELLQESFVVATPDGKPLEDPAYAAVVVEVQQGSVVTRASTLIYLDPGRQVPLPLLLVSLAVLMAALAAGGWAVVVRRGRSSNDGTGQAPVRPT